jgi:hypothetical protein
MVKIFKVRVHPSTGREGPEGEQRYSSTFYLRFLGSHPELNKKFSAVTNTKFIHIHT